MSEDHHLDVQFDRSGSHLTAYVSGEIDAASAAVLEQVITGRFDPSVSELWLDLSAVTFCDSSGLAVFIRLCERVEQAGSRFILFQPQPMLWRILQLTGLDRVVSVRGRPRAAASSAPARETAAAEG